MQEIRRRFSKQIYRMELDGAYFNYEASFEKMRFSPQYSGRVHLQRWVGINRNRFHGEE